MWPQVFRFCGLGTALLQCIPLDGQLSIVLLFPQRGRLFLCCFPGKERKEHRFFALIFSQRTLLLCMRLWSGFVPNAVVPFQQVVGFRASWGGFLTLSLEFGLDRLNLWMVLQTAVLMPQAIQCSWNTQNAHSQSFYAQTLCLESFLFACFTSLDILCFYVLYECSLIPMFLLIGLGGSRARKVKAAYLQVLYTLVGSLAMQPVLLLLLSRTGTTHYELVRHLGFSESREYIMWWGFFLAFAVKVPLMPLHQWLPEAHVERSTAGSVLLAGVLLKLGTYRLLRFNLYLFPRASSYFAPFVTTVCQVGIVYASLTTLRQVDLKKIVAYSSVAHISMVVLALFTMNEVGIVGSIFTMQAHGIRSPALFQCVGYLYDRTHTKAQKYLGGCATAMPLFSICFFIFTQCNMALPLTPNFVGEFLSLCGIFAQNTVSLVICLAGVILSAVYSLWAYARVVHGMPKIPYIHAMADQNRREWWTQAIQILLRLWFGQKPVYILDSLSTMVYYWGQCSLASLKKRNFPACFQAQSECKPALLVLHFPTCFAGGLPALLAEADQTCNFYIFHLLLFINQNFLFFIMLHHLFWGTKCKPALRHEVQASKTGRNKVLRPAIKAGGRTLRHEVLRPASRTHFVQRTACEAGVALWSAKRKRTACFAGGSGLLNPIRGVRHPAEWTPLMGLRRGSRANFFFNILLSFF